MPELSPKPLSGPLANRSLMSQVCVLAMWPMLQQALGWLTGMIDMSIAGHIDEASASALAVASLINWLMGLIIMSASVGSCALISRAVGAGRDYAVKRIYAQGLLLGFALCAVMMLLVGAGAWPLGLMAGLRGEALHLSSVYLWITALALPLPALLYVGCAAMSAIGHSRNPALILVLVNIVNAIASVACSHPVGLGLGVAGIALGTVIAWAVGACCLLWLMQRPGCLLRLDKRILTIRKQMLHRIVRITWPSVIEKIGHWGGHWGVLLIVGWLSHLDQKVNVYQGVHMIVVRLESMAFLPGMAFGVAASTLIGQYLGAQDIKRAEKSVYICWLMAVIFLAVLGGLLVIFPDFFVSLITNVPELQEGTASYVRMIGGVQAFMATAMVLQASVRGAGDTYGAAFWFNLMAWGVRLPLVWIFGVTLGYGMYGVWLGLCIEVVLRSAAFVWRFYKGPWRTMRV